MRRIDPVCSVTVSSPTDVVATFDSVVSVEQDGAGTVFAWGRAIARGRDRRLVPLGAPGGGDRDAMRSRAGR